MIYLSSNLFKIEMILPYANDELNCDNSKSSSFSKMLYSYTHFVGEIHLGMSLAYFLSNHKV